MENKTHNLFTPSELELFQSIFGKERIRLGFMSNGDESYEYSYLRQGFRYWEKLDELKIINLANQFNSNSELHIINVSNFIDGEDDIDMDRSWPASFTFTVSKRTDGYWR